MSTSSVEAPTAGIRLSLSKAMIPGVRNIPGCFSGVTILKRLRTTVLRECCPTMVTVDIFWSLHSESFEQRAQCRKKVCLDYCHKSFHSTWRTLAHCNWPRLSRILPTFDLTPSSNEYVLFSRT